MAELVYILCAVLSSVCALMLLNRYRKVGGSLLLWTGLSFVAFALNNIILVIDIVILPQIDFNGSFWRSLLSAISGAMLIFGLIWELA